MDGAEALTIEDESVALFKAIRSELLDEYRQDHDWPWIIGYSGGKDSTLVAHLVFEMLLSLPPSQRTRQVHIVANDTLVESPLVVQHIIGAVERRAAAVVAFKGIQRSPSARRHLRRTRCAHHTHTASALPPHPV